MKDSPSQDNPTDDISILENKIQRLTDLIKKEPSVAEHYYQRGVFYGQLNYPLAAIQDFGQVIVLDSNNAEAHYNRGIAHVHLKEHLAAIHDFSKAID